LSNTDLFAPLTFKRGPAMKNRFMLAPLTNQQSHEDGVCSEDEFIWLTKRAEGGFGLTMTCAAHVQAIGQGFAGQLGIFSDIHLEGLTRLASAIKAEDSLAVVQLHHAGMRSPKDLIGEAPVCPSDNAEFSTRALTTAEVEQLIEDFIAAAERAQKAGFDGVELHGAHGYILCQFLSGEINQRSDRFGGSLTNRARVIMEIIAGIRARCRADFNLGLRLSPERFGLQLAEILELTQTLMTAGDLDYIDLSLWDVNKLPEEEAFKSRSLMAWFMDLDRGHVRVGVAGKVLSAQSARDCLEQGADFVLIGRGAILHHDYPLQIKANPDFTPIALPVTEAHLLNEGLSPAFVTYMRNWKGFVAED
jgi:2,4-dienoyl-CoA reductase-like NADH-dependent reductase (Old Yellow Enzyme family)